MKKIPPQDKDDALTRKNIKFAKTVGAKRIASASPKKTKKEMESEQEVLSRA